MNVKYQIFVSSTYEDLKDERNEVIKACLNMGHIPVGMEMFNAADEEQWQVITRTIDQCDYYVVIVAHRYGSVTPEGVSFTEKEYDYAVAQGVPVLGFVIEDGASWPSDRTDKDQAAMEALQTFKTKVKQKMVRGWRDKSDLQAHFAMSLSTYININPRRGWVRAPEATDVDIAQALSNLTQENARLRKELDSLQSAGPRTGDTESIVAALERFRIRRQMEGKETTVTGGKLFRELANSIPMRKSIGDLLPGLDGNDLQEFKRSITLMRLVQTSVRGDALVTDLTSLGGIVYARLMAQPES